MGNVVVISLYQDCEADKEKLYSHFVKVNLEPQCIAQLHKEDKRETKVTEIVEVETVKYHIIDFINQNLTSFSERDLTELLKYTLNEIHSQNKMAEFKFVFLFPYSKLGNGFSVIKHLMTSMNKRITNSMFLLMTNDTVAKSTRLTDCQIYELALQHREIQGLITLSEKENILLNYPLKESHKDNFVRALRLASGVYLNEYTLMNNQFINDGKEILFGNQKIEWSHQQVKLIKAPRLEETKSRTTNLMIGENSEEYIQLIESEGGKKYNIWVYAVLMAICTIVGVLVYYFGFSDRGE